MTCTAQNSGTFINLEDGTHAIKSTYNDGLVRQDHHLHSGASFCNLIGAFTI